MVAMRRLERLAVVGEAIATASGGVHSGTALVSTISVGSRFGSGSVCADVTACCMWTSTCGTEGNANVGVSTDTSLITETFASWLLTPRCVLRIGIFRFAVGASIIAASVRLLRLGDDGESKSVRTAAEGVSHFTACALSASTADDA